ncbi:cupin domain-containing protein [Cesiribacter sp. SM1]|uniref:cupin domain-containing protein n=1 Tax=Cesiribacter sp. SM1 TaxID=2861196 RepID=UPI001CD63AC8|nr:cupin domain-containing protein [Cesiribacter sp. SM1]
MQTSDKTANPTSAAVAYRSYMGGYYSVLISPEQNGGSFALLDMTLPKGVEPPRHMHTKEDESFYLIDGEIDFHIDEQIIKAKPGQAVFAPRMVPHHFALQTPTARFLTLITPGGFAEYFEAFSTSTEIPAVVPPQGPPPAEFISFMTSRLETDFRVLFT